MGKRPDVKKLVYAPRAWVRHRRCSAQVLEQTSRWRMRAGKDDQCELGGLYSIDGVTFCKRHAGYKLLELLVSGEEVIE